MKSENQVQVQPLTQAAQITGNQILHLEKVWANRIEQAATNHAEMSLSRLIMQAANFMSDHRITGRVLDGDFLGYVHGTPFAEIPIKDLVQMLCIAGDLQEVSALTKHFDIAAAFCLPDINKAMPGPQNYRGRLEFIKDRIQDLCTYFGVGFPGAIDEMADTILDAYGGFSLLDFVIFFKHARSGRYQTEHQYISTRGINAEFLTTWLRGYAEEREQVYLSLKPRKFQVEQEERSGEIQPISAFSRADYSNRLRAAREQLKTALIKRDASETEISEAYHCVKLVEFEVFSYDESGVKTGSKKERREQICKEGDTGIIRKDKYLIKVDKPGTAYKRMVRMVEDFVVRYDAEGNVVGESAKEICQKLTKKFRDDYTRTTTVGFNEEHFKAYARSRALLLVNTVTSMLNRLGALSILRYGLAEYHQKTEMQCNNLAHSFLSKVGDNWLPYAENHLAAGVIPLTEDETKIKAALNYLRFLGVKTPLDKLNIYNIQKYEG